MASSSRPFQSQTVARLLAGYRQVAHGTGQWLRRGRTAVVWGLQVAVYPLYAAVQGMRMAHRQLRAARPWQPLWARLNGTRPPELVEADTPIRALLSIIQPPPVQTPGEQSGGLRRVRGYGQWLRQSRATAVLTPGQWHLIPLQAPIRGLASDLATQQLVLVTVDNGIFAGLSADQQRRLHQAIVLMLAEYGRLRHRHTLNHTLQQPWLPLPEPNPTVLPPLRWLPAALRWLQTSPLAAATSLFGEARQQRQAEAIARRQVSGADLAVPEGRVPPGSAAPAASQGYGSPPIYGRPDFKTLPATTSVADAVALIVATPGAVAVAERARSPLELHGPTAGLTVGEHTAVGPAIAPRSAEPLTRLAADPISEGHQLPPPAALEVQVTQVNYIDAPLVAVLRGLDWVLYQIETWLRGFWAWLQKQW
ncbi:hypothetical protein [Nodosilinea nodulosa]|uniref:hypothetical protein n=1 Tax=Nodosilinea nodulosa TaxID=416001 RepID=UPI0002EC244E|nr:hypothetical protein [Nodosilinea nodulosa]